jgi:ABC-type lipoprotein export system ATPase subunit
MAGEEIAAELVELNRQSRVTMLVANHGAFPYDKADRTLFIKD